MSQFQGCNKVVFSLLQGWPNINGEGTNLFRKPLAFVDEVLDTSRFATPGDVHGVCNQSRRIIVVHVLSCDLDLVKNSIRLEIIGNLLGNATVFALAMLAFVQLQQAALLLCSCSKRPFIKNLRQSRVGGLIIVFVLRPQERIIQVSISKYHLLEVDGSSDCSLSREILFCCQFSSAFLSGLHYIQFDGLVFCVRCKTQVKNGFNFSKGLPEFCKQVPFCSNSL